VVKWSKRDIEILKALYPTYDVDVILMALDYKFSWHAIRLKACELGLQRLGRGGSRGQSRYEKMAYCSRCAKWYSRSNIENARCPRCKTRVRMPGPLSFRRRKR